MHSYIGIATMSEANMDSDLSGPSITLGLYPRTKDIGVGDLATLHLAHSTRKSQNTNYKLQITNKFSQSKSQIPN